MHLLSAGPALAPVQASLWVGPVELLSVELLLAGLLLARPLVPGVGLAQNPASPRKTINMNHIDFRNMLLLLSEKFG